MNELLWLIPALPIAGFLILVMAGSRISPNGIAVIGAGSVGLSAVLTVLITISFIASPPPGSVYVQTLWYWVHVADFSPGIAFFLDPLSLVMILVITFVGFLIHLYSVEYMREEEGYGRFFAYMNLFVGSMVTLVLADNLLFLYLGWEGVGLCSYLLIGFWYRDPANGYAARKAFVVTRIGDVSLALALFILYNFSGSLQIRAIMDQALRQWQSGSVAATVIAFLLLGGAVGKSAQLPLQTWLPDAMAGPTPVSALIHAATMVTAGVYLIARTHVFFILAPTAQTAVAIIGAATLLLAGSSALVQRDIKRVLAYSTISQIGYMFLALGVGAWSAAIFHFMVHAFFKALLFLGAGILILGLDHERDMFNMGGLRKQVPLVFWTFLIGSASLSALPLVTAGFYSKDLILWKSWSSPSGSWWLWTAGLLGAFLTSLYTFRMVFITFFGEARSRFDLKPSRLVAIPLTALAVLSVTSGFIEMPATLGGLSLFSGFIGTVFPSDSAAVVSATEIMLQFLAALASLAGLYCAIILFMNGRLVAERFVSSAVGSVLVRFWFSGWGFDRIYDTCIIRPVVWLARVNRDDVIDLVYGGISWFTELFNLFLSRTQSGNLRWYISVIAMGVAVIIALVVFL
jgi:NADH-quinone oxidoreductase subunit L